jgi:uncharacterized protein with NRDE domain
VRRSFDPLLMQGGDISKDELFGILADTTQAGINEQLPKTGLSPEWEQLLSSPFIRNEDYGTRCSTIVLLEPSGAVSLTERRFNSAGSVTAETEFSLHGEEWL